MMMMTMTMTTSASPPPWPICDARERSQELQFNRMMAMLDARLGNTQPPATPAASTQPLSYAIDDDETADDEALRRYGVRRRPMTEYEKAIMSEAAFTNELRETFRRALRHTPVPTGVDVSPPPLTDAGRLRTSQRRNEKVLRAIDFDGRACLRAALGAIEVLVRTTGVQVREGDEAFNAIKLVHQSFTLLFEATRVARATNAMTLPAKMRREFDERLFGTKTRSVLSRDEVQRVEQLQQEERTRRAQEAYLRAATRTPAARQQAQTQGDGFFRPRRPARPSNNSASNNRSNGRNNRRESAPAAAAPKRDGDTERQ